MLLLWRGFISPATPPISPRPVGCTEDLSSTEGCRGQHVVEDTNGDLPFWAETPKVFHPSAQGGGSPLFCFVVEKACCHHWPLMPRMLHGGFTGTRLDPWGKEQSKNKSFWERLKLTNKWCFWGTETIILGRIQWIMWAHKYYVKTWNLSNAMFCFRKYQHAFSKEKYFKQYI